MSYEALDDERASAMLLSEFDACTGFQAPVRALQAPCSAPQIHYVDESEVEPMLRSDELGSETRLAAELGAAADLDELTRLVGSVVHVLGFRRLAYLTVKTDVHGRIDRIYLLRNAFAPSLMQRMVRTGMLERNARLRTVLTSQLPQPWELKTSMRTSGAREFADEDRQFLHEMRENGFLSGLAFGLPISNTSMRSIVILASSRESVADWLTEDVIVQCLTFGSSLHQRCAAYLRAAQRQEAFGLLSPLHRQIVDLLVLGLTDKEIAARLDMSAHTVDYHLRHIKQRYGARDRSHLAFIAGSRDSR
ncbi:hypothetical protein GWC77_01080 [Paraburkholderia sp. NMBU_R16]|uniref:helix-turn-helix transcriptional regulator n=1 Tax=Paraburkholderia sp. NMBU_R16 TaxID=2698676 RepID=UPI0015667492|nr:autoinducer binding domain-containing protein [Paraburkholderia sp. NMBU_R16]NRO94536.1 hypothetical protein [Paraburkholderia sp. NMBU_R16]